MQAAALFFSSEPASAPSVASSAVETVPFAQVFAQAQQAQQQIQQPQPAVAETPVSDELSPAPAEAVSAEALAEGTLDGLAVSPAPTSEGVTVVVATALDDVLSEVQVEDTVAWPSDAVPTESAEPPAPKESAPAFQSLKEWQTFLFRQQELPADSPVTERTDNDLESEAPQVVWGTVEVPAEVSIQALTQAFIQHVRDFSWAAQGLSSGGTQGVSGAIPQRPFSVPLAVGAPLPLNRDATDSPLVNATGMQASGAAVETPELQTLTLSLDPAAEASPAAAQTQTQAAAVARTPLVPLTLPQAARELDKRFQVFRQVEERLVLLRQQHQRELQLQLEPAQLGKLKLRLQQEGALFHLQIVAETPMVKELLDAQMQQLRQQFAAQGFTLDRVDVDVQGQMGDGSPSQDSREAYVPVLVPVPAASFSLFEAAAEPLPHLTYGSAVSGFYYHQVNYLA